MLAGETFGDDDLPPDTWEYRVAYDAPGHPGTLQSVLEVLVENGLKIRRAFVSTTEVQANSHSKRGQFKVVANSAQDPGDLERRIKGAIEHHYKRHFPNESHQGIGAEVESINTTKHIHFSVQSVSRDIHGVAESLLGCVQSITALNCPLGIVSFILIPVYERQKRDNGVSFIDIRGFVDDRYIYDLLDDKGRERIGSYIASELNAKLLNGPDLHYQWAICPTSPKRQYSTTGCNRMTVPTPTDPINRDLKVSERPVLNLRVIYGTPNVPGIALATASALKKHGYNIRRAFIGESNVAITNKERVAFARGRFNVTRVNPPNLSQPTDVDYEKKMLSQLVQKAIEDHLDKRFDLGKIGGFAIPAVEASEAVYTNRYYFGVQIRLGRLSEQSITASEFLLNVTKMVFERESDTEWINLFAGTRILSKPRMNVERLAFLVDYTGKLHHSDSQPGDSLIDMRISFSEHWDLPESSRFPFAQLVQRWLWNRLRNLHGEAAYIGIRLVAPLPLSDADFAQFSEIYDGENKLIQDEAFEENEETIESFAPNDPDFPDSANPNNDDDGEGGLGVPIHA